LLQEVWP